MSWSLVVGIGGAIRKAMLDPVASQRKDAELVAFPTSTKPKLAYPQTASVAAPPNLRSESLDVPGTVHATIGP
jgi:hypothetical protein